MSAAERLIAEALALALALPLSERAKIVYRLLLSMKSAPNERMDAAWLTELEVRADAVQSGAVSPIPWDIARAAISTELNKRRAART